MGQYYYPASLDRKQHVYSWDYESGLKLMEHSWLKNPMVLAIERLLMAGNAWHKTRIVWAGDYADNGAHVPEDVQKAYGKWLQETDPEHAEKYPDSLVPNVNDLCHDKKDATKNQPWMFDKINPAPMTFTEAYKKARFIVNHTKKEFVDKRRVPSVNGWRVHPLPLLTSSGNGRGGGDYHPYGEEDAKFVGSWAGDVISVEPAKPEGYTEIRPNFKEE